MLLAHGVTLLLTGADSAVRWAWCRAATAVVRALLPLVIVSQQQSAQVAWLKTPNAGQLCGVLVLVLAGAACATVPVRPLGGLGPRQLALPLPAVPPAVLLLVSYVHPLYHDRYILYCHTGLALLIGAAADRLLRTVPRPKAVAAVVTLATMAALLPSWLALRTPRVHQDDTNAVSAAVGSMSRPGDGVLFLPAQRRESRLTHPRDFAGRPDLALGQDPVSSGTLHGIERAPEEVRARMLTVDRIVTLTDPPGRPRDNTPTAQDHIKATVLAERFERCAHRTAGGLVISVYARRGKC